VVVNGTSRFHLAIEAIRRSRRPIEHAELLIDECRQVLKDHSVYVREHFEDLPEIRAWTWTS
jgi:xylulose-5-phosphate/fructose-6-phosphate phosphoketolase